MPFKIKKTVSSSVVTGNSVYFTGASQYLSTPVTTSFDPGTNTPWTLEYWGYPINGCIVTLATGVAYGNSLWVSWGSSQFTWLQGNSAGSNPVILATAATYPANNWYHIVVCKDSANTSRMFINGTQVLSSTYNSSLGSPNRLVVNGAWDNNGFYGGGNGYVSNVRWIKGTALYTASFTVPTAPLTAIANTQLLTCQSATIIDNSTNNFTITNNNTATVSSAVTPFSASFSPFKIKKNNPNPTMLTGYGASFDGTNNVQTPSNAAFGFGTGDWTIEGWFRASTSTAMKLWRFSDNSDNLDFDLGFSTFGGLGYYNGSNSTYSSAGIITSSIWYHIAAVRKSGTASVYLNGVSVLSQTSTPNSSARSLNVGSAAGSTFNGYISNFRVLKGTALYSASFAPPTAPLTSNTSCSLLTCNAVTIIDGSSNSFTLTNNGNTVVPSSSFTPFSSSLIAPTNYSTLFNGSNQYLSLPNTSALDLGSNNFTMEAWVYPASISGNKNIFYINGNASSYSAICLYVQDSQFAFLANQTGGYPWTLQIGAVGPAISSNTWYHVAATRSGNSFYVFVNGTLVSGAPYTLSGALYNGTTNIIGYQPTVASYFNGYISNARIINGTALYTASFTPPNSPLTAIANTKLLTCNSATIVDNSTNNFAITNNNAATVSSTITPFSASVSNSGFKLKQVSYVRDPYMVATGGDLITTSGSYKVHTFTTVGTSSFVVSNVGSNPSVECLVVAGGGGGGAGTSNTGAGSGGGGGGVIYSSSISLSQTGTYVVVVGNGGIGGSSSGNNGSNGAGSSITGGSVGVALSATGGGYGATNGTNGGSGGSGGGGAPGGASTTTGGTSTSGQGNSGGNGVSGTYYGASGGGATSVGSNSLGGGVGSTPPNGGLGYTSLITGTSVAYSAGGAGGYNGSIGSVINGSNNTGNGGNGGSQQAGTASAGGSGGSGVVVIKYRYTT